MDGMYVIARIAHLDPVMSALPQMERGGRRFASHRVGNSVDRPTVEAFIGSVLFDESHLKGFVGIVRVMVRLREGRVIPARARWGNPLRFSRTVRIDRKSVV